MARFALGLRQGGAGAFVGLAATVFVHALWLALASGTAFAPDRARPAAGHELIMLRLLPEPQALPPEQASPARLARPPVRPESAVWTPQASVAAKPPAHAASQPAPTPPTAEEWAFASGYRLKNSKAYRHAWGQQVRSMMGTAVEGPEQGVVRFRVEIAPDGSLSRLETLWSTSATAERLARQAIAAIPRWPATPTGQPLVFEKTLSFSPFANDDPPVYRYDCLPDPPAFSNPFAWDGRSAARPAPTRSPEPQDPQALEDCLKQLPKDSIEAETARDRRVMERWGWSRTGR